MSESTYYTPRRLAQHLRDARKRAGVSQLDMANRMCRTQSWVSLFERGQISITEEFLERWCDSLDIEPEARQGLQDDFSRESEKYIEWRLVWSQGVDQVQRERGDLEQRSLHLRMFQASFVHSLLQIPQYTEAIYFATRFFPDDSQLTNYLQARLARQSILHAPDKRIDALMTEGALRSMIAKPEVMSAQMEHLVKLSERDMVNIAIVPFTQPLMVVPHNNWEIFDESVAVVELVSGQMNFTKPDELALYVDTFELLWEDALQGNDARQFLWRLARDFESHEADES